ncbi:hypothetical protein NFI96_033891 [Prochilodus magdalenae]|nr:hypothetical protein NFI96_033891 [Prochilodus magdalenae]
MPSACESLIDDIEDMVSSNDPTSLQRQFSRQSVVPRVRKRKEHTAAEELQADSIIPGMQKVWMRTWGCSHNNSDGEYMAGQLAASGYKMTGTLKTCCVCILARYLMGAMTFSDSPSKPNIYLFPPQCYEHCDWLSGIYAALPVWWRQPMKKASAALDGSASPVREQCSTHLLQPCRHSAVLEQFPASRRDLSDFPFTARLASTQTTLVKRGSRKRQWKKDGESSKETETADQTTCMRCDQVDDEARAAVTHDMLKGEWLDDRCAKGALVVMGASSQAESHQRRGTPSPSSACLHCCSASPCLANSRNSAGPGSGGLRPSQPVCINCPLSLSNKQSCGSHSDDNPSDADVWLLNSCTVKNPAEDHFRNSIKKAQEQNKKVVVAGCVPQAQPRMDYLKGLSIIGVQQIDRVVEVVDEAVKGHSVRLLGQKKDNGKRLGGARLDLPKIRKNPLIEIISINTGCLNACTYCKTKHARGDLASYPIEELVERARQSFQGDIIGYHQMVRPGCICRAYSQFSDQVAAVHLALCNEGVCEIWLTSEDTGAYGRDIGTDLPSLLWELVKEIPEGCMLRLGMTNPPYILEHLEEMAKILNHPRVYGFLHVPVQTASDSVLMDMKREYCCDDFRRVVDFLKDK